MRGRSRVGLLAVVVALVISSAGLPAVAGDWDTERWRGQLVSPPPDDREYYECQEWSDCHDLRGVSIEDLNVTSLMEGASDDEDEENRYTLHDTSLQGILSVWGFCMYDENHTLLKCDWNLREPWKKGGEIPAETRYVRILVQQGVAPEYSLSIGVMY